MHANGVDFLFDGAKDRNSNRYTVSVAEITRLQQREGYAYLRP
jgi:hypothetical protein